MIGSGLSVQACLTSRPFRRGRIAHPVVQSDGNAIVDNLIMASAKRERERRIFAGFVQLLQEFSGEPLAGWDQPEQENDFPDIIGETVSGRRIGVELGEWLNAKEMAAAMTKERREECINAAIGQQGDNPTTHIKYLWLHPKGHVHAKDYAQFREQLFDIIRASDERWPNEPYWQRGTLLSADDLKAYPVLAKYLDGIRLFAKTPGREWPTPDWWILFPAGGGFFNKDTMLNPLKQLIASKTAHYGQSNTGFTHLSLLLYYEQAVLYNSPYATPLHPEEAIVEAAKESIGESIAPFERIFLYIAIGDGRVFRLR
jgi:hypothetical protein